jgi:hypothetical protein
MTTGSMGTTEYRVDRKLTTNTNKVSASLFVWSVFPIGQV